MSRVIAFLCLVNLLACQSTPRSSLSKSSTGPLTESLQLQLSQADYEKLRVTLSRDAGLTVRIYRQLYMDTKDFSLRKLGYALSVKTQGPSRWIVLEKGRESWKCRLQPDNLLLADIMAGRQIISEIDDQLCRTKQGALHPVSKLKLISRNNMANWSFGLIAHSKATVSSRNLRLGDQLCGVSLIETQFPQDFVGFAMRVQYPAGSRAQLADALRSRLKADNIPFKPRAISSSAITQILTWPEQGPETARLVRERVIFPTR